MTERNDDHRYSRMGEEFVLHKVPFPYQSEDEDKFVIVKVIEERDVRGTWGGGQYTGHKAEATWSSHKEYPGHIFICNWETFPDDSMSPMWTWYDRTRYDEPRNEGQVDFDWYDITQGLHDIIPDIPKCLRWYEKLKICFDHNHLYLDEECFSCKYGLKHFPRKRYWNGW